MAATRRACRSPSQPPGRSSTSASSPAGPRGPATAMRPPDGLCARCRRTLPPEHERDDLTIKTDVCGPCGNHLLGVVTATQAAKAAIAGYWARLRGLERAEREP